MILTGKRLTEEVSKGRIEIDPFNGKLVNENSCDVTLGSSLLVYTDPVVDTAKKNPTLCIDIPHSGLVLEKGKFYVGYIVEYIGSEFYVPMLHGLPSVARKGLFIHVTANLIDIGNHANFSLQLYPTEHIRVYPGMQIAQVSFWRVSGRVRLYKGKYKNVRGPAASQSYEHSESLNGATQ